MIRPLRDNIVCIPLETPRMVGALWMPDNDRQALRTHYKALVLYSGPKAQDDCPRGSVVHISQSWGEEFTHEGRKVWIGRTRDINGILPGEVIEDKTRYMD